MYRYKKLVDYGSLAETSVVILFYVVVMVVAVAVVEGQLLNLP